MGKMKPKNETDDLIRKVKTFTEARKFSDAARCLDDAATMEAETARKAHFWRQAAALYKKAGEYRKAADTYQSAGELLESSARAECLMASWKCLISGIVAYEYDCSWEWRGDSGDHESGHDTYQNAIKEYQAEAERVLFAVLHIEGLNGQEVLKEAGLEYKRLEKAGGWGASRCKKIIEGATNKS